MVDFVFQELHLNGNLNIFQHKLFHKLLDFESLGLKLKQTVDHRNVQQQPLSCLEEGGLYYQQKRPKKFNWCEVEFSAARGLLLIV